MFLLRYLILIFILSYLFWYVSKHFFKQPTPFIKVIAYGLLSSSVLGLLLWSLSVLIEGH